jgi:magnesium transporter
MSPLRMLASCSLKPLAPSISLLRFLRSQSEYLCFFTSNSGHIGGSLTQTSSNWRRLNPAPCRAQLEASLFSSIGPLVSNNKTRRFPFPSSCQPPLSSIHPSSRHVSTKNRPLFRKLLGLKRSKDATKRDCAPSLMDDGAEGNLFNLGRTLTAKTLNEPCLRCTEFDENGNVTLVNGEYKKSELIAKVSAPRIPVWVSING